MHIILIHHPTLKEKREREKERDKHIFSERIVERNAIEFGCFFHAPASFVCRLRKSIVRADTLRKEASLEPLSAGASAALGP